MVEELVEHVGAVRGEEDLALVRRLALGDFAEDLDHFADKLGMDAVFRFLKGNQRGNVVEIEQGSDCEQSQHAITDLAAIIRRGAGSLALVKHDLAPTPASPRHGEPG